MDSYRLRKFLSAHIIPLQSRKGIERNLMRANKNKANGKKRAKVFVSKKERETEKRE